MAKKDFIILSVMSSDGASSFSTSSIDAAGLKHLLIAYCFYR